MGDLSDYEVHINSLPGKTYVSPQLDSFGGRKVRIANKVIDAEDGHHFATIKGEVVLRDTPTGRVQVKATFTEDDRAVQRITIQKYTQSGGQKTYFTFLPHEVAMNSP